MSIDTAVHEAQRDKRDICDMILVLQIVAEYNDKVYFNNRCI